MALKVQPERLDHKAHRVIPGLKETEVLREQTAQEALKDLRVIPVRKARLV